MARWLPLLCSFAVGVATYWYAPANVFEPAAGLLATFAGFVAAAVIPTMVLAATILRPAKFGLQTLRSYRSALRSQLDFFAGMLLTAALLIFVLVVGAGLDWQPHYWDIGKDEEVLLSRSGLVNALIASLSSFLLIRTFSFVGGVRSLFELHFKMVEQEAADQISTETARLFSHDSTPQDPRPNFGTVLKSSSKLAK